MDALSVATDADAIALECDRYADAAACQAARLREVARQLRQPATLAMVANGRLAVDAARVERVGFAEAAGAHEHLVRLHVERLSLWRQVVATVAVAVARWALR